MGEPCGEGAPQPSRCVPEGARRLRAVRRESWVDPGQRGKTRPVPRPSLLPSPSPRAHDLLVLVSCPPPPVRPPSLVPTSARNCRLSRSCCSEPQASGASAFLPWGEENQGTAGGREPHHPLLLQQGKSSPKHPSGPREDRSYSQGAQRPASLSKSPEQAFCIYSPKCVAELRSSPWLPAICREKSS